MPTLIDSRGWTDNKSYSITPTLHEAIVNHSMNTGRTRSEIVREALELYFRSLEQPNKIT